MSIRRDNNKKVPVKNAANIRVRHPGKQVFVLAGFGNSYGTDSPFLKYIVSQTLPAGKPVSVMINGGKAPTEYRGLFIQVRQDEIVSGPGFQAKN